MRSLSTSKWVVVCLLFSGCNLFVGCGAGSGNPTNVLTSTARTSNPLVAQVTVAAPCAGEAMIEFGPDTSYGRMTSWNPIPGNFQKSGPILVAGMRASTTYHMRADVQCPAGSGSGEDFTFTTGSLPTQIPLPALQVIRPSGFSAADESPGIEMVSAVDPTHMRAFFTDRDANPIWYYDVGPTFFPNPLKILPNGHLILVLSTGVGFGPDVLREVDLAGNLIREMSVAQLGQKMRAAGFNFSPNGFHHDVFPLDNGHLILLTNFGETFNNLTGYSGATQVIGDGIVDLDQNWNPVWTWNSFDHLDVNRHLNGLPDWTHSNGLVYLPQDGNLLLSIRHQSWILKIDYENGAGTGDVLWTLGYQGDVTLAQGAAPSLWFSFQHFPTLLSQTGNLTMLAVWDNGDNRPLDTSGTICGAGVNPVPCYSRATIFQVDDSAKVANLLWSYVPEPGAYSIWGGSINQLSNGNVEFDFNSPGNLSIGRNLGSLVQEVTQTGTPQVVWEMDFPVPTFAYRAYRVPSLYPGVTWQY